MSDDHKPSGTGWPKRDGEPETPDVEGETRRLSLPPGPEPGQETVRLPDGPPEPEAASGPEPGRKAVRLPDGPPEPEVASGAEPGQKTVRLPDGPPEPEVASGPEPGQKTVRLPDGPPEPEAAPEPESATEDAAPVPDAGPVEDRARPEGDRPAAARRRISSAGVVIAVLLALLGFTLVVQVKSNSADSGLASARQEDLVRILSDLEAREERLRDEIADLEDSQRQLTSGAEGRQAALDEATRRADELGVLAGTLPARGPGLTVRFQEGSERLKASAILDAVQELRGAGAEAMQIAGADGTAVRIVASTWFLDSDGGIQVDGRQLSAPYTITVIGEPRTMETALQIPGGVVESVENDNGTVIVQEQEVVDVSALRASTSLQHARPTS